MTNLWQILKIELKEWAEESGLFPLFIRQIIKEVSVKKRLTLLFSFISVLSLISFVWYMKVERISGFFSNFNIYIVSIFSFYFLILGGFFIFLPVFLYLRILLKNYGAYFLISQRDCIFYWNILFSPAFFLYFSLCAFLKKDSHGELLLLYTFLFFSVLFFILTLCCFILFVIKKINKKRVLHSFQDILYSNSCALIGIFCAFFLFLHVSYGTFQYEEKELASNLITFIAIKV